MHSGLLRGTAGTFLCSTGDVPTSTRCIGRSLPRSLRLRAACYAESLLAEAAFARLAGVAPIPASSGQTIRYRLDRSGDRQLNRALHQILVTRRRIHPPTIAYIERRISEGKTRREANRCLKRYLARSLFRLLENGAPPDA